jgi:O-acetyl-ADP-ribose deacetylase (regulator of RNase III)
VGDAVLTGGGDLPASHVVHAAAMGDEPPSAHTIRSSTRRSMEMADEHGIRSIAFPILGTGVAGFDFGEATGIMVDEIRRSTEGRRHPETVVLFGYLDKQAETLRSLLEPR